MWDWPDEWPLWTSGLQEGFLNEETEVITEGRIWGNKPREDESLITWEDTEKRTLIVHSYHSIPASCLLFIPQNDQYHLNLSVHFVPLPQIVYKVQFKKAKRLEDWLNWLGLARVRQITPSVVAYAGQRGSSLFGLVDGIPPSIAHIFFLNPAGLHSSNKLRPVCTLGGRMSVQMDSLTTGGRCTPAVVSLGLHWDNKGTCTGATIHEFWHQLSPHHAVFAGQLPGFEWQQSF